MKGLIGLYYNTVSNRAFEGIRLVREYFSEDGNLSGFRKMQPNNLSLDEKIMLMCLDKNKINISEDEYIARGYLSSNGDRYIFTDINITGCVGFKCGFNYVADPKNPNSFKYITVFFINRNIKPEEDEKIINLSYYIAKKYFMNYMVEFANPIHVAANHACCNNMENLLKVMSNEPVSSEQFTMQEKIFYIDFLITMIMILDVMFDFKFADFETFKSAIANSISEFSANILHAVYDYAIDTHPNSDEYLSVFKRIIDNK